MIIFQIFVYNFCLLSYFIFFLCFWTLSRHSISKLHPQPAFTCLSTFLIQLLRFLCVYITRLHSALEINVFISDIGFKNNMWVSTCSFFHFSSLLLDLGYTFFRLFYFALNVCYILLWILFVLSIYQTGYLPLLYFLFF